MRPDTLAGIVPVLVRALIGLLRCQNVLVTFPASQTSSKKFREPFGDEHGPVGPILENEIFMLRHVKKTLFRNGSQIKPPDFSF